MLVEAEPSGQPDLIDEEAAETILAAQNIKVWFPRTKNWYGKPLDYVKAVDGIDSRLLRGDAGHRRRKRLWKNHIRRASLS